MNIINGCYPAFFNLSGRRCVVVGGGGVARRKVMLLLESGAEVEVISPELGPELAVLAEKGRIKALRRHYRSGDLQKAFLAFAATGDASVNRQVATEAKGLGIPVNVADDAAESDFIVPASARRGSITLAVATGGVSPALAQKLRTRLAGEIGEEYKALLGLVGEARAEVHELGLKPGGDDWQKAIDLDVLLPLLEEGDIEKARTILIDNLKSRSGEKQ